VIINSYPRLDNAKQLVLMSTYFIGVDISGHVLRKRLRFNHTSSELWQL